MEEKDILDAISEGILVIDKDYTVVFSNQTALAMCGLSSDEVNGKKCHVLNHHCPTPCDLPDQCPHKEVFATGKPVSVRHTHVCPDGKERVYSITASPIRDEKGAVVRMVEVLKDVTECRRTEEKLRNSEHKHRTLLANIPGMVYQGRSDWSVEIITGSEKICGYSADDFLTGRVNWLALIHPEDKERVLRETTEIIGRPMFLEQEYRITAKDDDIRNVIDRKTSLFADNKLIGVDGIVLDITERKKAQDALRKSEAFVKSILESVGDGFMVIDPEYKIISANKAYCDQTKLACKDIVGRHCYEVSHHIDKPCFMVGEVCAPMHTFKTGEPTLSVHTHYDAENSPIFIETRSFPMKDASGKITAVIETLNNITEQKKLEEQLRQAQKMEAVGTLAGGVAHYFNNILSAIIGYGHLSLMKMKEDDPVRTNIDQILACSQRAAALTQSLLLFSRKSVSNPVQLDLNELLHRFEKFIMRLISEDIEFTFRCGAGALPVMADSGQIEQAIMNLVTNACDAMPGGGRLLIETDRVRLGKDFVDAHGYGLAGEFALISISDTGIGMDETTKAHIFEPFFTTKEQGKGTGLGLSMVYGIIKKHDGFINVYSEPGKGTTFRIYLPITDVKAATEEAHREEPVQSLEGAETVLLAEDDEPVRRLTRTVLENFGYTIIEAIDGEDAINKFIVNKDRIQLAILDAIMPKKNGGEVFKEIQAMKPGLPVLFMSGYPAEIVGKQGILEPGTKFVPKPVSPSELLRKVREALG